MKRCRLCGQEKELDEFHYRESTKDHRNSYCKDCAKSETRRWYRDNKERASLRAKAVYDPSKQKDGALKRLYGLSLDDYTMLLDKQGGVCAICKQLPSRSRSLHVDHDHATGKVRGLLCHHCNTGLGLLGESLDRLKNLQDYLVLWEEQNNG